MTRLVSVALPALLLGFVLDRLGAQLGPQFYPAWAHNPVPLWELLLRGVTFSDEWGDGNAARHQWSLLVAELRGRLLRTVRHRDLAGGTRRVVPLALGG